MLENYSEKTMIENTEDIKNTKKIKKIKEIKKYLTINKNQIIANKPCEIFIDKSEYKEDNLIETAEYYILPGIIDIYFPDDDVYIQLPFMFDVHLYKPENIIDEKDFILLKYDPGDIIIAQKYKSSITNFKLFNRLIEGGTKFIKSPEQLVLYISKMLNHSVDLVHIEVLVQHIYRCKDDPKKPGRLCGYKNAELVGIKKVPYLDSWLLGVEFERINQAIQNGLINKTELSDSPFEKLFLEY